MEIYGFPRCSGFEIENFIFLREIRSYIADLNIIVRGWFKRALDKINVNQKKIIVYWKKVCVHYEKYFDSWKSNCTLKRIKLAFEWIEQKIGNAANENRVKYQSHNRTTHSQLS